MIVVIPKSNGNTGTCMLIKLFIRLDFSASNVRERELLWNPNPCYYYIRLFGRTFFVLQEYNSINC